MRFIFTSKNFICESVHVPSLRLFVQSIELKRKNKNLLKRFRFIEEIRYNIGIWTNSLGLLNDFQ